MVADNQASDSQDAKQEQETTTQIFIYNSSKKAPTSKPEENN